MCIILIGKVTKEQYKAALAQNGDGFSLFTKEQGLVKCPTDKQVAQALGKFGIWHFRIATSGRVDEYNVHPFEICDGKYLLYHNGVLGSGLGDMSDTHALAETLKNVPVGTAKSVLKALEDRQRFVIVSAEDPRQFLLYGDWVVSAGVLMSHQLYTSAVGYAGTRYKTPHPYRANLFTEGED